jgi:ABC-type branched-subunit amino acid transport system ATPase component
MTPPPGTPTHGTRAPAEGATDAVPEVVPILAVHDVYAGYGEADVLHGLSLRVNPGEIVTIIGPNGSGKSTLLKAVVGLVRTRAGSVLLNGKQVTNGATEDIVRAGLGYVPQVANVFGALTIRQNLEIGGYLEPQLMGERLARVHELFPLLAERARSKAAVLSGGERQMLAVARALMLDPSILLLDEPSAALAPNTAAMLFQKIAEIGATGTSILLVEQNARLSLSLSNRGYVVAMGRNELEGNARTLLEDEEVGRIYLGR